MHKVKKSIATTAAALVMVSCLAVGASAATNSFSKTETGGMSQEITETSNGTVSLSPEGNDSWNYGIEWGCVYSDYNNYGRTHSSSVKGILGHIEPSGWKLANVWANSKWASNPLGGNRAFYNVQ